MSADKLAAQVEQIVLNRIANDKLALPAMPVAAAKCLRLLRSDDFSTKALTSVLEQDPVLTARVLRVASSAAFSNTASSGPLTLANAVVRMGTQKIRALLVEASAQQLFESRDKRIAESCRNLLEHSTAVAVLARDLAALSGQSAIAETAYVCGLLHDIGKVVVATVLLEAEKMVTASRPGQVWVGSEEWLAAIDRSHRGIGVRLCEKWVLPEDITRAVRDCADYDSDNRAGAANFVRFANALSKREGVYEGTFDAPAVETLIMIGRSLLNIDEEVVVNVTRGLRDRIRAQA